MWYGVQDMVRESLALPPYKGPLRSTEFWALDNISFDVNKGECVGIIGANGAGKTTLLRIISGLIKLNAGCVQVNGRVAPLLALGAGFIPVLTGRENVFANMSILGLNRKDIQRNFDEVVEFAEIGDAIDAPVQTYSSGMGARLGFACAVHTQPDVLVVDEVLSVGDMRFRSKCYRRLAELREQGVSILLVSHNTNAILSMCDRVIYLRKGKQVATGSPVEVMGEYERDLFNSNRTNAPGQLLRQSSSDLNSELSIRKISLSNESDEQTYELKVGSAGSIRFECDIKSPLNGIFINMIIREISGENDIVLDISGQRDGQTFDVQEGAVTIELKFPMVAFKPGTYSAKISVGRKPAFILDAIESFPFKVFSEESFPSCQFFQPREWKISYKI